MAEDTEGLQNNPPKFLKGSARTMYTVLQPILDKRGTKKVSQSILEGYCMTYGLVRESYSSIQDEGIVMGNGRKNPAVQVYQDNVKNLRSLGNDLGLSPASLVTIQKIIVDNSDEKDTKSFKDLVSDMEF